MPATYIDKPSDKAFGEFEARCEACKARLRQEDFLHNRGLGNEVGIYTFCYDPRLKNRARGFFDKLKADPSLPCSIREENLYDILLEICEEKHIAAAIPRREAKQGQTQMLKQLSAVASPEAFAKKIANRPNRPGDVILITGVGEVYPFMRAHNILDNIQHLFEETPVIVAYPGRFNGQTLSLFGRLCDGNYYRAFDLI
ncbi:MAG: DUF1788 domain-containing protein [Gordonibacter sp.]|uniref:DUF1788 domain-containing protein n=1 Tax=Gordonibacter sp. TaxID=1968902 RepID=UPI002FCB8283